MGDSYTIQISSKLINQLAQGEEKVKRRIRRPKPKVTNETVEHGGDQKQTSSLPPVAEPNSNPTSPPLPPPPVYIPVPVPLLSPPPVSSESDAIRAVLQDSEKVLEKLKREESHMLQELNRRTKELHDKEFKLPYQNPVPCTAERADCSDCYRKYPKDPLKCAEAVKRYSACTRRARQGMGSAIKQQ